MNILCLDNWDNSRDDNSQLRLKAKKPETREFTLFNHQGVFTYFTQELDISVVYRQRV